MAHLQTLIRSPDMKQFNKNGMIKIHSAILFTCSVIGFTGHYLQFGVLRPTPWIPASAGCCILLLEWITKDRKSALKYVPLLAIMAFGILTTNMCIRFLPQDFQPVRKKIVFTLMSLSAWVTVC